MVRELTVPVPRLTVITLGVSDIRASIAFYDALGFSRRLKVTGEAVAFYDTGGPVLALYPWDQLAADAALPDNPRPSTFRGMTLAWNCRTRAEVDAVLAFAVDKGAALLKAAHETDYGGYAGYFTDPDGHPWEVVVAPGIDVGDDRRVHLGE
ncbi:VOC family protein [Bradyrhizobium sp. DN5]|uniref:VOC family protein n=1 Tax=Bradyrhizobium sp. DN5 TaxID=3056950 RepID=UPI003525F7E9